MKYLILDQIKNGDLFVDERETAAEAKAEARRAWDNLSERDRARREFFGVLESVNPNPEAPDHTDGNIILIMKQ